MKSLKKKKTHPTSPSSNVSVKSFIWLEDFSFFIINVKVGEGNISMLETQLLMTFSHKTYFGWDENCGRDTILGEIFCSHSIKQDLIVWKESRSPKCGYSITKKSTSLKINEH